MENHITKEYLTKLIHTMNYMGKTVYDNVELKFEYTEQEGIINRRQYGSLNDTWLDVPIWVLKYQVIHNKPGLILVMQCGEVVLEKDLPEFRQSMRERILQSFVAYALLGEGGNMVETTKERQLK